MPAVGARRIKWRLILAALAVAGAVVAVVGVLAPPERCPSVTVADLDTSTGEAVDWFRRNQQPDGTWLYLYNAETATAAAEYNVVRHMGVLMSLYQAATAGVPGALETADQGLPWAERQIIERDNWAAVRYGGQTPVGATALLVAGLAERRIHTGDPTYDGLLRQLGRFLVAQTEASGAVLAYYSESAGGPLPGEYSKYYTGEAYWALARLHRVFPNSEWGQVADRVGAYMAVERDDVEDYWPPLPDHWAAYGLAETAAFESRPSGRPLTSAELEYARRQAGLFGAQVRWVSQQAGPWGDLVRGTMTLRGGGYGVVGEALTGLWQVARADDRMADLREPIADRAMCMAGLAVRAQTEAAEAAAFQEPERVQGGWFRHGETRMDDQQHALSALLRTIPIVAAASEDGERPAPSEWLWLIALVAAFNPFRAAFSLPQATRSPRGLVGLAAVGGLIGGAIVIVAGLIGGVALNAINVSDPALRIAAGVVAAVVGVAAVIRRAPSPEPALPGWLAAVVPVAVPVVANVSLLVLAVSAHADRGLPVLGAAVAVGVAMLAVLAAVLARPGVPPDGVGARVLGWAGRLAAALLVVASTLLVINGIFDV